MAVFKNLQNCSEEVIEFIERIDHSESPKSRPYTEIDDFLSGRSSPVVSNLSDVNSTIAITTECEREQKVTIFKNLENWAGESTEFIKKIGHEKCPLPDCDITEEEYLGEETDPTVPDHVKKITEADIDRWNNPEISGLGNNYNYATNKPSINGVTLQGNKTTEDLGVVSLSNLEIERLLNMQV
jgi:hypothetical protein